MRLWTIHPKYLDTKGILALWREALLAKKVLEGKTKGYKNHPQLNRFKVSELPLDNINYYLSLVYEEACLRGFNFSLDKFYVPDTHNCIEVKHGQILHERLHLLKKVSIRDKNKFSVLSKVIIPEVFPLFRVINGDVENWERVKSII